MISITDGAEGLVLSFLIPVLQTEWNLTEFDQSILGSSTFIGFFIGCLLSGQLADRYGRRKPLIYGVFLNFVFGLLSGLSNTFNTLVFMRFFFGIAVGVISPLSATYMCEVSPMKYRGKMLVFTGMFYTFGELITCFMAYLSLDTLYSGNWRALVIWSAVPGFLTFMLSFYCLQESPRYLLVFQKYDEAFKLINQIIKMNGLSDRLVLTQNEKDDLRMWADKQAKIHKSNSFANPLELFREGRYLITPFLWIIWYVLSCVYYGNVFILPTILKEMSMENKDTSGNELHNVFLSILSGLPSSIISYYIIEIHCLGRKNSLFISFALTSLASFGAFGLNKAPFIIFVSISRFFLNIAFSLIYPFTTEVYPTRIRATGLGTASSFSRIGGITSPWISIASLKIGIAGPFLIFGVLSLLAAICTGLLPYDTTGVELDKCAEENKDEKDKRINENNLKEV